MVSHVLSDHGHQPIIMDSMTTGSPQLVKQFPSYVGDIADKNLIKAIINQHSDLQSVVHCAGKILVPESVMHPDQYYYENVSKSLELFTNLNSFGINKILFSSSASIYEANNGEIVNENSPLKPLSPYAKNKLVLEMILEDFCKAFGMKAVALRYFNPIGADPKMRCGPGLTNTSHLLGNLVRVAEGITNDINCIIIDALMYGKIPNAKTENRLNDPPENRSIKEIKLFELTILLNPDKSIPEIGICEPSR